MGSDLRTKEIIINGQKPRGFGGWGGCINGKLAIDKETSRAI